MLYWDPSRFIFTIPIIDRPIAWYGLFFVLGFLIGFFIVIPMFKRKLLNGSRASAVYLTDKLTWMTILGTLIGARLGFVFFYEWPRFQTHPFDILKVWEGGLASHGGAIGILIALIFFRRSIKKQFPEITFLDVLDIICIPTALTAAFIRVGNFFNQEILGSTTNVPWAVTFGHPMDGSAPIPRHPVQLYEAFTYFVIFVILYTLWYKWSNKLKKGMLTGLFLVLVFGSRFLLEFFKIPDSLILDESFLLTSQYLSIPFILGGIYLIMWPASSRSR